MVVLAIALSAPLSASVPFQDSQDTISELPDSAWQDSITALDSEITPLENQITSLELGITPLDQQTTEGEETVISLDSDILFSFGKSDISDQAGERITDLLTEVPSDATVAVHGHTDAIGTADFNQSLSEDRAQTVAEVIAQDRPDLDLEIEGYGEDRAVEPNTVDGEDNPAGRALNRRVEIRYEE